MPTEPSETGATAETTFPAAREIVAALQTIPSVKDGEPVILLAPIQRIVDRLVAAAKRSAHLEDARAGSVAARAVATLRGVLRYWTTMSKADEEAIREVIAEWDALSLPPGGQK